MICYGQFITKTARRVHVLADEVLNGLSAPFCCRLLDTTSIREIIDSNGRLISEEPAPGNPKVDVPRPLHHSIYELYDRMGRMEIRWEIMHPQAILRNTRSRMRSSVEMTMYGSQV
ncbi:hypothetical protein Tco_1166276 [Tanacetum coccineum]